MLGIYRLASVLAAPLVEKYLRRRRDQGKEDPIRFSERLGKEMAPRPQGTLVWIHAASVGESLSALPIINRLLETSAHPHILVTTGTLTSARIMAERLPEGALHQYVPVDLLYPVRRFLDHWQPDLALWIESEFWPNLMLETHRRNIPMVLVNARISRRSFAIWRRLPFLIRPLLETFSLSLGQDETEAERLTVLGAKKVAAPGNLKYVAAPLPADETELARMDEMCRGRPLWLAASTHPGEEEIVSEVDRNLRAHFPNLLTIIVPRHPGRGAAIDRILRADGHSVARRSSGDIAGPETDIYLADTLGELGLFYRLARAVFMGGSLVHHGGQNPLEPGQLGCAIALGPHTENFRKIVTEMRAGEAAIEVKDMNGLTKAMTLLLSDPTQCKAMGKRAAGIAGAKQAMLGEILSLITPFLDQIKDKKKATGGGDANT
mgnify:CR=1 FL=1